MFALFATHCLHLQQHTQFFKRMFAVTLLYILFYLSTLLFVIAFQKMPKQAASGKTKVNAFIREFHNEFISTPTDELFCKLCEKVVKHDKRSHVDQHRMVACSKLNWQFQLPARSRLYRPQTYQILRKRLLKRFWAPIFLSRSYVTLQIDVCLLMWGIFCQVSLPVEELLKILQRKKRIKWYITSRIKISLLWLTKQKLMEKIPEHTGRTLWESGAYSGPGVNYFTKCPKSNNNYSAYWRLYQKITNWKEEFCAATFRFCIIYDSRWKAIKVTLQQFISRYLCRVSPSQLRRKNRKQV